LTHRSVKAKIVCWNIERYLCPYRER